MASRYTRESKLTMAFLWFYFSMICLAQYTKPSALGLPDTIHKFIVAFVALSTLGIAVFSLFGWMRGWINHWRGNKDVD